MSGGSEPHPKIARLIEHWRSLSPGPGLLPGRQHFQPSKVADLLPNIWLVDVIPGEPRGYRYRLIGGMILEAGNPGRKGERVDDPRFVADPAKIRAVLDGVIESHQPDWARGKPQLQHVKFVHSLERVFLPLATDGRTVDMLLCMTLFHWADGRVR